MPAHSYQPDVRICPPLLFGSLSARTHAKSHDCDCIFVRFTISKHHDCDESAERRSAHAGSAHAAQHESWPGWLRLE